jgi:hypothetical protein
MRQLQRLWLPPKHAKLLQEPPPAKFSSPLLSKLVQQSTQHVEAIAAALHFCLAQLKAQGQQQQQQQQEREQGLLLLQELVVTPEERHSSTACFVTELLMWLHQKPGLAADLSTRPGAESASGWHLQEMWLAGMQVWQLMCLLAAAAGETSACVGLIMRANGMTGVGSQTAMV